MKPRECIVCGAPTLDRSGQHRHPRCAEWLACALRRNAARVRPRPESEIVAQALELGHPVEGRDVLQAMHRDAARARARGGARRS